MCDLNDAEPDELDEPVGARYIRREDIPDGKILTLIDTPTETLMAVHPSHMSAELADELNHHLAYLTRLGIWRRAS
jgi:hypothetical protein